MKRASFLFVLLGLLAVPTALSAQEAEYPMQEPATVLSFGAQRPGQTFNKQDCGFHSGTTATIRVNQTAAGTKEVGPDRCVRLNVGIVDQDTISVDGREYPAQPCGSNVIFVTAPVAGGTAQSRQVENRFTIACAVAAGNALPRTGQHIADLASTGAALIVMGSVLVLIVWRRRSSNLSATA